MSHGKRLFDIVTTVAGLLFILPIMAIVAAMIAVTDGTPVLFRQERIGHNGVPFKIIKFRTMTRDAEHRGRQLTIGSDPRVTRIGHRLRRSKLDELPQLFNVLKGEMSLVGPRPEVPRYVSYYTEAQKSVLALCPGITDPASVRFRGEAAILAGYDDPEEAYFQRVMPEKIRLNLDYARRRTLVSDVGILLATIWHLRR